MKILLSTDDVPRERRLAYWREALCDHFYKVDCFPVSDRVFKGEIRTTCIKNVTFTLLRGREHKTVRTASMIRHSDEDVVLIVHQVKGTTIRSQGARTITLLPGDFTCFESTCPTASVMKGDFEQLVLKIPGDLWNKRFGRPEQVMTRVIRSSTPLGSLLANVFHQLLPVAETVDPLTSHRLLDSSLSLVSAALGNLISKDSKGRDRAQ